MPPHVAGFDRRGFNPRIAVARSIVALMALMYPVAAFAQSDTQNSSMSDRTLATSSYVEMTGGHVTGCGVTFQYLTLDEINKQGMPISVNGSYGISVTPTYSLGWALKIILNDISDPFNNPKFIPSAPVSATMLSANGYPITAAKAGSFSGETPGSLLIAFKNDDTMMSVLERIVSKKELAFTFNRSQGGLDITVTVDLQVKNVDGTPNKTVAGFTQCMRDLPDQIKPPSK